MELEVQVPILLRSAPVVLEPLVVIIITIIIILQSIEEQDLQVRRLICPSFKHETLNVRIWIIMRNTIDFGATQYQIFGCILMQMKGKNDFTIEMF